MRQRLRLFPQLLPAEMPALPSTPSLVLFRHQQPAPCVMRVFCCPHAGAGPAMFAKWAQLFGPDVELYGILLPGRQTRLREQPWTSVKEIVTHLVPEIQSLLNKVFSFSATALSLLIAIYIVCTFFWF